MPMDILKTIHPALGVCQFCLGENALYIQGSVCYDSGDRKTMYNFSCKFQEEHRFNSCDLFWQTVNTG